MLLHLTLLLLYIPDAHTCTKYSSSSSSSSARKPSTYLVYQVPGTGIQLLTCALGGQGHFKYVRVPCLVLFARCPMVYITNVPLLYHGTYTISFGMETCMIRLVHILYLVHTCVPGMMRVLLYRYVIPYVYTGM